MTVALLRFHMATGGRLAMRASVPLAAVFVVVLGLNSDPDAFLRALAARVAATTPDPAVELGLLALAVGLAGWASPRITLGLGGWIRHLPASSGAHRRAAGLAIGFVLAPVLTLAAVLMIAGWVQGAPVHGAKLAGLPLLGLGASYLALPSKRRAVVWACAFAAAICSLAGSWLFVLAGGSFLAAADVLAAGPVVLPRHERQRGRRTRLHERLRGEPADRQERQRGERAGRHALLPGEPPDRQEREQGEYAGRHALLPGEPTDRQERERGEYAGRPNIGLRSGGAKGHARAGSLESAAAGLLAWTIARRAVGFKPLQNAFPSFAILGACALFLRNNDLTRGQASLGARLAGGLAVTVMLAGLADLLAVRRPVWPWARTLPWTASRRIALDAMFLATATLPLIVVLAGLDGGAALSVLATLPLLSLRAASAMRRGGESATTASGAILAEGAILSAWLAILPWMAPLFALASLPAFRLAARRERTLEVGRWSALHHSAAGDPLSWEGR